MKKRIFGIIAMMLVAIMALSGCAVVNNVRDFITGIFNPPIDIEADELNAEKIIDFANGADPDVLFESDGWTNGDVFNVVWKKDNVKYEDGVLKLAIVEEKASAWLNDAEVEYDYTAGEARTQNYYGYGDYEVSMKPSSNPGTASTFFICTGPYDIKYVLDENGDFVLDENGQRIGVENPHDEIDIEFLGNDTTHVQFNFFVDGKGGNEYMYDLGFDASEEFHEYGFRWTETSITWFVDNVPVYMVTTDASVKTASNVKVAEKLPSTAGRILTNYWCGNEDAWGWMGQYQGNVNDNGTEYQWIATSASGAPLNPPEKPDEEMTGIDWSAIEAIAPTFASTDMYTVENDGTKSTVTYTAVGGSSYINVEMDIAEASAGKNYLHLTVTNNAETACRFRVNVVDSELVLAGAQNMSTNQSATVNGEAAFTDLTWGGSFFDLAAGETYEIVIAFNGVVEKLQLMPDSSKNDASVNAGNITVDNIKFATVGEVEIPHSCTDADGDAVCDKCGEGMIVPPSPPEYPISGNLTLDFGGFTTNIGGNVTDGYGVNVEENNVIDVTYTNIIGDSYKNIWADVSAIAGTKTTFSVKVKNYGDAPVKVRIDIESQTNTSSNTTCCNVSASQDGSGVYTDTEWGGSMFEIAAGATATLEVVYNPANLPTNVKIMIDSATYQDSTSHAGHVEFFDISFSGEYTPDEGGDDPEEPKVEYNDLYVEFKTENAYTLTSPDTYANNVRVTYSDIAKNSWNNINIWVANNSTGCSIFTFKLTNNGENTVSVWVQMKDAVGTELINENKNIAAGAEEVVSFSYSGEAQMVFFFVDSTHEAAAESNAGDITISELKLGKVVAEETPDAPPAETPEGEYLSFTGNDCYTLSAASTEYVNSIDVTYTAVSNNTYQNVNTWIQDKAAGKATAKVTIKNNGTETVKITVKLENSSGGAAETNVVIAAGESITASLAYTFAPDQLYFFIDSGWSETTASHAGNVTISGICFS